MKIYKLSAILFGFLGACTPDVTNWTPAESPKENKVERTVFTHTVDYPAHSGSMREKEKKNLLRFLKTNVRRPSAVTALLVEYGGHSEKRIKDIIRELIRYGIPYDLISIDGDQEERHLKHHHHKSGEKGSGVDVIIELYIVIPPACANFSQPIGDSRQAYNTSNYGCSDATNLGLMVSNPRDLLKGRELGSSDGTVIAAGVERYRKDNVKQLLETSTTVDPGQTGQTESTNGGGTTSGGTSGGGAY